MSVVSDCRVHVAGGLPDETDQVRGGELEHEDKAHG
jgi:hypothetical protein